MTDRRNTVSRQTGTRYTYSVSGSAALAGRQPERSAWQPDIREERAPEPILRGPMGGQGMIHQRGRAVRAGASQRTRVYGLPMPRVLVIVLVTALFLGLLLASASIGEKQEQAQLAIEKQHALLSIARDQIATLDADLEKTADSARIRSIAINRLGMQEPQPEQVFRIPVPVTAGSQTIQPQAVQSADASQGQAQQVDASNDSSFESRLRELFGI